MTVETDIVLSAIRRGEDSLPRLRVATGLEYAQLHVVLHELEYEWRSIHHEETPEGFSRFVPMPSERSNGSKGEHWKEANPVSPRAQTQTRESVGAREATLLQRDAPYCVQCRAVAILHGTDRNRRIRWRCKPCDLTFAGSGATGDMNRTPPEKREQAIDGFKQAKSVRQVASEVGIAKATAAKIRDEAKIEALCPCGQEAKHQGWCSYRYQNSPARQAVVERMNNSASVNGSDIMRERVPLGPEEEQALDDMREGVGRPDLGDEEEETLAAMRGGELAEDEARIAEEIDQELTEVEGEAPELCGCGRDAKHNGRCAFRRTKHEHKAAKSANNGRPRIAVDLKQLEDLLANPEIALCDAYEAAGMKRNMIYYRKDHDPAFRAAYERGMKRRNSKQNTTNSTTSNGDEPLPDISPSKMEPKQAMAKERDIIPEKTQAPNESLATVDNPAFVLYDSVDDCVSEVVNWPKERIAEFFEGFARAMGLPQRPARTEIKLAWSKDFEDTSPDGTVGLTHLYLISMLHHHMEPHEKEAVWTLVQYLKRLEAYVEQEKANV